MQLVNRTSRRVYFTRFSISKPVFPSFSFALVVSLLASAALLVSPKLSFAGKPNSPLYFMLLGDSLTVDRDTNQYRRDLEQKFKVTSIEQVGSYLELDLSSEIPPQTPPSSVKIHMGSERVALLMKGLFENSPMRLSFLGRKKNPSSEKLRSLVVLPIDRINSDFLAQDYILESVLGQGFYLEREKSAIETYLTYAIKKNETYQGIGQFSAKIKLKNRKSELEKTEKTNLPWVSEHLRVKLELLENRLNPFRSDLSEAAAPGGPVKQSQKSSEESQDQLESPPAYITNYIYDLPTLPAAGAHFTLKSEDTGLGKGSEVEIVNSALLPHGGFKDMSEYYNVRVISNTLTSEYRSARKQMGDIVVIHRASLVSGEDFQWGVYKLREPSYLNYTNQYNEKKYVYLAGLLRLEFVQDQGLNFRVRVITESKSTDLSKTLGDEFIWPRSLLIQVE